MEFHKKSFFHCKSAQVLLEGFKIVFDENTGWSTLGILLGWLISSSDFLLLETLSECSSNVKSPLATFDDNIDWSMVGILSVNVISPDFLLSNLRTLLGCLFVPNPFSPELVILSECPPNMLLEGGTLTTKTEQFTWRWDVKTTKSRHVCV